MPDLPRTPSFRLDGKRALVAGASSGIGLGCAVALAEHGAEVVLAARRLPALEETAEALKAKGLKASALEMDIADVERTATQVAAEGPFDILVNSAGIARHGPSLKSDPSDFDAVQAINLKGAYFLARAAAAGLKEAGKGGSIITISSQMAHVGGPDRAVYCASKHAVEGFTKAMAIEWGPLGIRINTICPTFILTDLTRASFADPQKRAWIEGMIQLPRVGEVEDIMGATVFLASDASAMVTGTSLLIDGGWTAE